MDWSLPGSSVHGTLQAKIPEWVSTPSSRGIFLTWGSNPRFLHWRVGSSLNLKKKKKQLRLSQPYYSVLSPLTIYPNPSQRAGNSSMPMEWFGEQLFPGSTYKVKAVQHNLWWADPKINPKHQVLHEMIPNNHLLTDINWSEWAPEVKHTKNQNS